MYIAKYLSQRIEFLFYLDHERKRSRHAVILQFEIFKQCINIFVGSSHLVS